jgi:hypothetical protein
MNISDKCVGGFYKTYIIIFCIADIVAVILAEVQVQLSVCTLCYSSVYTHTSTHRNNTRGLQP